MSLKGPWLPFLVGMFIVTMSCPIVLLFPETIQLRPPPTDMRQSMETEDRPLDEAEWLNHSSRFSYLKKFSHDAWNSSRFIFQDRTIVLILSAFFLSVIGRKQIDILLLYVSTKFSVPISDAAFTLSVFAAANIFLLLVLLPLASRYLTKNLQLSSNAKDLALSRMSIILLTIGCFALGVSPTIATMVIGLIVYTLGCGFVPLCLSLISTLVEPRHAARLYAIVSLVTMAGALVGGPFLAVLFDWGLNLGTSWSGLPFFGTGVIHIFVAVALYCIKIPDTLVREES